MPAVRKMAADTATWSLTHTHTQGFTERTLHKATSHEIEFAAVKTKSTNCSSSQCMNLLQSFDFVKWVRGLTLLNKAILRNQLVGTSSLKIGIIKLISFREKISCVHAVQPAAQ